MTRTFIELPLFRTKWEDLGLDDKDLRRLQDELLSDPKIGDVIEARAACAKCGLRSNIAAKAAARGLSMWILKYMKKSICLRHILKRKRKLVARRV